MAKGLVYFARNSAFQHLTKIGKTTKPIAEERGLSGSNVPEDFDYFIVFECEDCDWVEKSIHEQFDVFRHKTASGRKTEFFWSGCIRDATKFAEKLKGVTIATDKETEKLNFTVNGNRQTMRRPNTTFKMINIKKGTKIFLEKDPKKWAIVKDNKNQISYKGQKPTAISNVSTQEIGRPTNGFEHFFYKGKRLVDMRPDLQK